MISIMELKMVMTIESIPCTCTLLFYNFESGCLGLDLWNRSINRRKKQHINVKIYLQIIEICFYFYTFANFMLLKE